MPGAVTDLKITPSNFSALVVWRMPDHTLSSYITHYFIYLNNKLLQRISRKVYNTKFTIIGLKPYTEYSVGIQTQDGSSQKSAVVYSPVFKTKEAGKHTVED